jgi:hypothetical protein
LNLAAVGDLHPIDTEDALLPLKDGGLRFHKAICLAQKNFAGLIEFFTNRY